MCFLKIHVWLINHYTTFTEKTQLSVNFSYLSYVPAASQQTWRREESHFLALAIEETLL